jgi:hypothetical protein
MINEKFERLTIIEIIEKNKVKVLCDCGKEKIVRYDYVVSGRTRSCGCLRAEMLSKRRTTHGMTDTREYRIWCKMKERCSNLKDKNYKRYGGRGIKICSMWINSFEKFYSDMGPCGEKGTIDRINPDGDYCKDNCRWLSIEDQQNNRRNNHVFSHNGESMTLSQWARKLDIKYGTLYRRVIIKNIIFSEAIKK